MINPSQIPLPDNTHYSQQTNIHAPGKIRTHNLSRRAAEDLRLRPRGHWDRLLSNGLYLPELKQTEPVVSNHSPPDTAKVINAWVSISIPHFFSKLLFLAQQPPPQWARVYSLSRFLNHIRRTRIGRTPLDEWSVRLRDLYLTTHNTHNRQTSITSVGFEPSISTGERPQTYALDRAATGTGFLHS